MKHLKKLGLILLLILITTVATPINAQDDDPDCNGEVLQDFVEGLHEELNSIETEMDLIAFGEVVQIAVDACTGNLNLQNETNEQTPETNDRVGFSRSNPVPLGEFFEISTGRVRIISVEERTPPESSSLYTQPEGEVLYFFNLEYECQIEDENETCEGGDVLIGSSYILSTGNVIEENAPVYVNIMNGEGYSGATLNGGEWFSIPENEPLNLLRVQLVPAGDESQETIFFSLSDNEEDQ